MFRSQPSADFGKTLSTLWLFAILNVLFRDIHEFAMASTLNDVLSGHMNGNPITETLMLVAGFGVVLLLLAFLLSAILVPIWARRVNLLLAPIAALGHLSVPPADPDDYLFAIIVISTFVLIFVLAYRWTAERETL